MILVVLLVLAFIILAFGPLLWVRWTLAAHDTERADFPGTGGQLAEHLIAEFGLDGVKVEKTDRGDHYDMDARMVRLGSKNLAGKSVTAAAVAAHEVGHALQHRDGYGPLAARHRMVKHAIFIQRVGSVVLMASPLIFALTRAPSLLFFQIAAGLAILGTTAVIHAVTLPTEFDASFRRALPILERYLPAEDMPAARSVLRAAAFTYVAAALVTLLDVTRWLRLLRF
jgi:uncharacterized protein